MIYIIADDLTGATDTGVQFSKQGYTAQVLIVAEAGPERWADMRDLTEIVEVLVIDTETREMDADIARVRLRQVLRQIPLCDDDIVYKKVDSTLRGHVGAELDECLKVLQKEMCLFTPSFPQHKRITVEGYLIVHDQPLGLSEYYAGQLDPDEASYIPAVLRPETDLPVARIDLQDVIRGKNAIVRQIQALTQQGKKILVVDAMNDQQLRELLGASFECEQSILYAGSAGLANAISEMCNGKHPTRMSPSRIPQSVLIVSGSMRSIARRQLDYLKTRVTLCDLPLDVERIVGSRAVYLKRLLANVTPACSEEQHHVLIYPDALSSESHINGTILSRYDLTFRELGLAIRDFLGELVVRILDKTSINNLILTGGDTAIGVCEHLGIHQLTIVDELLPGIPLSLGQLQPHGEMKIVTKAGGFGKEDTLHALFETLMKRK